MSDRVVRCGMHHLMEDGPWLGQPWACEVCDKTTWHIAKDCRSCAVCVCLGCVKAHGDHVSFALHLAQIGRKYDSQAIDEKELKHFQRTQARVAQLEAQVQEAERMVEELERRLALFGSTRH
jgi:hypothetical protein